MKAVLHAVGRSSDVVPFVGLGARVHEVESAREALDVVKSVANEPDTVIILSEEFAAAAEGARDRLVVVLAGIRGSAQVALEKTRQLVSRSVGVDLVAKAERT
jgi:hypothetical protein